MDCPLNLAASVSSEFARLVTNEFTCSFSEDDRAEFLKKQLDPFFNSLRAYTEYACACGGVMFKPYPDGKGGITVNCVLPGAFIPLAYRGGKPTSACFFDFAECRGDIFVREEIHREKDGGYVIENRVFPLNSYGKTEACLSPSEIPAWRGISPHVEIDNLNTPLFAYFKIPMGSTTSPSSPLGESVFSRVVPLLREADKQFSRLLWEFEGGELAIDVAEDVFTAGRDGKPVLPAGKERLFRPNSLDPTYGDNEILKTFSPELRDKSLINGFNRILMLIEDGVGLARGTFSDPTQASLTATEIRTSKQRTYSSVCDIQHALDSAICDLVNACSAICDLYNLSPAIPFSFSSFFGDSVLSDSITERSVWLDELKSGVVSPEEYRAKWHGDINN